MSGSVGEIRQQIGEILATVRGLDRAQVETGRAVERAVDGMQRDMSALKHEQRNAQQATQGRLEIMSNEQLLFKQRLTELEKTIDALKLPVEQWVSLRKRAAGFVLMSASIIAVVWAVVSPLWAPFAQKLFGLR